LYKSIDFISRRNSRHGKAPIINFMPRIRIPAPAETRPPADRRAGVPVPLGRQSRDLTARQNNYYGNLWPEFPALSEKLASTVRPQRTANGVFYYLSEVRIADITDGTSQTAFFSENSAQGGPDPRT